MIHAVVLLSPVDLLACRASHVQQLLLFGFFVDGARRCLEMDGYAVIGDENSSMGGWRLAKIILGLSKTKKEKKRTWRVFYCVHLLSLPVREALCGYSGAAQCRPKQQDNSRGRWGKASRYEDFRRERILRKWHFGMRLLPNDEGLVMDVSWADRELAYLICDSCTAT